MRRLLLLCYILVFFTSTQALNQSENEKYSVCVTSDGSELCYNGGYCVEEDGDLRCQCPSEFFGSRCERRKCQVVNPCYNGGLCEKTTDMSTDSFVCHCPLGFEGRYCLNRVPTVCDTKPCVHGRCTVSYSVNEYTCMCHHGYTGVNCTDVDHCLSARCVHGNCSNTLNGSGHKCVCEHGWMGTECDVDVDECAAGHSHCANGGQCYNVLGDYICRCASGFGGKNCQLIDDGSACREEICLNGGACVAADAPPPPTSPAASARREAIWRRFNALLDDYDISDFNDTFTTANQTQRGWRCDCQPGYFGARCEERVDECALNDFTLATLRGDRTGDNEDAWWEYAMCINGGICVGRGGSTRNTIVLEAARAGLTAQALGATCKCPVGFTGEHCEKDVDECATVDSEKRLCTNGGTCVNTFGGYRCMCVGGFAGAHCELNIDDCVDNICHPGSTCVDGVSRYDCVCAEGRIGMLCEHEDPCYGDRNSCAHGQCYSNHMYGNYTCACDTGFTGQNCEIDVDECAQNASLCTRYGGRCINTIGSYRCEHAPNCSLGLCQNHAFCLDYDNDYECICLTGFTGRHCETDIGSMSSCVLRCANGGTCRRDGVDGAEVCHCPPEFVGTLCDKLVVNKSKSIATNVASPSRVYTLVETTQQHADCRITACRNNGTCRSQSKVAADAKHYICDCLPGFAGAFCELDVNECLVAPCENQARCVDLINGFRCDCAPGFTGERCEININDCANVTCLHDGHCVDGVNSFHCDCIDGYAGAYCEVDLHAYERTDETQRAKCRANNCAAKAQNGRCDLECNFYACDYDSGDCALRNARPFSRCGNLQSYCAHAFGNGRCDSACNVEACLFDGFDCAPPLARCPALDYCAPRYADSHCDATCNSSACGWDGGDCESKNTLTTTQKTATPTTTTTTTSTTTTRTTTITENDNGAQILSGELSLIVLGTPNDFFRVVRRFLLELSAHLRASLRISEDDQRCPRIYAWRSDIGANETRPLALPHNLSAEELYVVYNDARNNPPGLMRFRKNVNSPTISDRRSALSFSASSTNDSLIVNTAILQGVKLYVRLDVAACMSLANGWSCFSELESAAQYLSADSAKMRLGDLGGVQLYSADAVRMQPTPDGDGIGRRTLELSLVACFLLIICAVVVLVAPRRKRHAPIWWPKPIGKKSKNGFMVGNGYGYRDFVNSTTSTATQYTTLGSASQSNRSLALQNSNVSNNISVVADNAVDGKAPFVFYPQEFNANVAAMRADALYATIGGVAASGRSNGLYSMPRGGSHTDNAAASIDYNSAVAGTSYSSSSGVSSGQASPNNDFDNNVSGCIVSSEAVVSLTLHYQAASKLGIQKPVDTALVNAHDENGLTPLHVLFSEGADRDVQVLIDNVNLLLEAGADINAQDNNGKTPLILAVQRARVALVAHLIGRGADVNLMDNQERAPLHFAIHEQHAPEVFRQLLASAELDLNAMERRRLAPLALCAMKTNCNVSLHFAQLLVEHGADVNCAGERGVIFDGEDHIRAWTPLHVAAYANNVPMIRLLVTNKANKDAKDAQERSPLCLAAINGNVEAVKELLTLGADKNQCDADEKTPVELALDANCKDVAALIENFRSAPAIGNNGNLSSIGCAQITGTMAASRKTSPSQTINTSGGGKALPAQRVGAKRVRTSPTAARKDSVKSYKTKRTSPNGAATSLMALTPPNSDQSTYSTTPSPNAVIGGSAAASTHAVTSGNRQPSYGGIGYDFYNATSTSASLRMPLTLMSGFANTSANIRLPYNLEAYSRVSLPSTSNAVTIETNARGAWTTASSTFYGQPSGDDENFAVYNNNNNVNAYMNYGNHTGAMYASLNSINNNATAPSSAKNGWSGNSGSTYDALSPHSICDRTPPALPYLTDIEIPCANNNGQHQQQQHQQYIQPQLRQQQQQLQYSSQLSLANFSQYGNIEDNSVSALRSINVANIKNHMYK